MQIWMEKLQWNFMHFIWRFSTLFRLMFFSGNGRFQFKNSFLDESKFRHFSYLHGKLQSSIALLLANNNWKFEVIWRALAKSSWKFHLLWVTLSPGSLIITAPQKKYSCASNCRLLGERDEIRFLTLFWQCTVKLFVPHFVLIVENYYTLSTM